jgi:hypothetical protein
MDTILSARTLAAIAMIAGIAGCSSWDRMDRTEGTAVGGVGGAVAGAVVGGPVGAVVGGVGGAYVGHETTGKERTVTSSAHASNTYDPALVRSVQQSLNDHGYNAGAVDGQWGPATRDAVRQFQQASGLPPSGELSRPTLNALGIPARDGLASSSEGTH